MWIVPYLDFLAVVIWSPFPHFNLCFLASSSHSCRALKQIGTIAGTASYLALKLIAQNGNEMQ
ncbi:hypothetical protein T11_2137 [Trichinella zimbabwensis]|uniref:Uncharacterized protein n=1 Tax=Trichinella zimbabwensis TaxID=268475 RepID=A0A0V1GNJ3_9BILA|nr:hypothetical protein T11_9744 [Trichinella zimbabwensis]KRZ00280.1 hypothetical protein T11_2137 [Trichinella zimbabwensis]